MEADPGTRPDYRTGLIVLSETECWDLLARHVVGRLAVVAGTEPDIFPVNYRVHNDEIVVRTEAGTKLAGAVLMGAVAFEIDEIETERRGGWSVVVHGRGREPRTAEEVAALDELDLESWVDAPKSRFLVIAPQSVSGRRVPFVDG